MKSKIQDNGTNKNDKNEKIEHKKVMAISDMKPISNKGIQRIFKKIEIKEKPPK